MERRLVISAIFAYFAACAERGGAGNEERGGAAGIAIATAITSKVGGYSTDREDPWVFFVDSHS